MIKRCLILIYLIGIFILGNTTNVSAKVCFLPDGNCEAGKATYSSVNNTTGCEYKDENAAKNGLGECQETYQSGMCYYRRCKMSEKECLEAAHASIHKWITQNYPKIDILRPGLGLKSNVINGTGTVVTPGITVNPVLRVTKQKCVVCKDGCWKLENSAYGSDTEHTCKEMGYKTKENCTADYVKFVPVKLFDKNGERCGKCENLACMEMGGLKTEGSCAAGEKFVYANKIDGFNNKCGTCEAVAVPLITIKITNKSDTKFDKTENSVNGLVMTKTTSTTTTSFTTTTSDNSTHKVQLRFTQIDTEIITPNSGKIDNGLISGGGNVNILKEKSVANTSNISNSNPRTITIGENESATTSHSQEIKKFLIGDSTAEATSSCLMTLIIDSKEVQSFAYQGDNLWCNELCKNFTKLNYDEVYSYDEYNVKFENSSEQIITKNTCATWDLKTETEANCGAGEIFQQDTTHKTDDNGDKCGTCVKTTPSTVTFAFVRQDCPSPHKGENRVAWIENGQLKYKTIDGSGEVPYSDEYVVLANVYVDSSAQRGDSYQEPLVYELDAGVMCAETNTGSSRSKCLKTQGTDLQYTQMFVGYPSGDNNIFPSLSTKSTMTPFEGGGYGMLLRLHGVEQKSQYTVRVSCESQCKASKNDDWHACYYGRRASGHYDCRSCR